MVLNSLSQKLRDTLEKFSRGFADKDAVEELVKDMQRALIAADVDVDLVFQLSESIRERAFEKVPEGLSRREHIIKVVYEELARILGEKKSEVSLVRKKILLAGLFGSGKTSTAAKLARFYQKKGLKPVMVCCDTARPAAYEQLQQLAQRIDVQFYGEKSEKDSSKILKNALKNIKSDVVIVDSSGRNALDKELIDEIKKMNEILQPDERILVLPADIGQAAKEQANAFHKALGITDVIITKLDATAKGGGALTACYETGAKVKFITTGETTEDLQPYDPEKFVARLLGMPDLETLLEKAKSVVDEKKAKKIVKGEFDLEDFVSQLESVRSMGPLSGILDMMGLGKLGSKVPLEAQETKMKTWRYVLQSMAPEEKSDPDVINPSRVRRIASGSGCSEADVRELINNYNKVKKMIKKLSPEKMKRGGMANMFRQMGMK